MKSLQAAIQKNFYDFAAGYYKEETVREKDKPGAFQIVAKEIGNKKSRYEKIP